MRRRLGSIAAIAAGLTLFGGEALAADLGSPAVDPVPAPAANDWRFHATIYGWLAGVNGNVGVRGLGPVKIDVTPGDAISDLDGALMASFGAENDNWLFLSDFMWSKVSKDGPIPDTLLGYDFSQTQITVQGLVGYRLPIDIPKLQLNATAGFRYQNISADLGIGPVIIPVSASAAGTQQWIDPTVGLYAHYDFNDRWFVTALGDVGGFGVGSNFTWQAFGAVGYNWSKTISTSLGYRAIYEDYESGGFVYDATQQGVFAGVGIHF